MVDFPSPNTLEIVPSKFPDDNIYNTTASRFSMAILFLNFESLFRILRNQVRWILKSYFSHRQIFWPKFMNNVFGVLST